MGEVGYGPRKMGANQVSPAEAQATTWAQIFAALVLIVGAVLVVVPTAIHLGEAWKNPFEPSTTTTTVVTVSPEGKTTKTTTAEASRSFVERSLASGGLLLLRIGIVALAAFLAGAVVQRTILGRFDMKLGPLEVPALAQKAAEASDQALEEVKAELGRQVEATKAAMTAAARNAEELASLKTVLAGLVPLIGEGGRQSGTEGSQPTSQELHFEPEQIVEPEPETED